MLYSRPHMQGSHQWIAKSLCLWKQGCIGGGQYKLFCCATVPLLVVLHPIYFSVLLAVEREERVYYPNEFTSQLYVNCVAAGS